MLLTALRLTLIAIQTVLLGMVAYLLLLTGAAFRARRHKASSSGTPTSRFLILIPAHNEERLLPMLLKWLKLVDYPSSLFQVFVIADNCTDRTAKLARAHGATVYERQNETERGKGYALRELLRQIHEQEIPHDAVLILDADSIISSNFLRVMDGRLKQGERVIQGYYSVRHASSSWPTALRCVALALLHYLRPLGRMVLGGSAGLKGNGMVFHAAVLRKYQWSAALTEDIEFHMNLILNGERVTFAPDAVVSAEMPGTLAASGSQHERWEQGRLQMVRRYVPQLLRAAGASHEGRQRPSRFVLVDAAIEHLIPPFSVLVGVSGLSFLSALLLPEPEAHRSGHLKMFSVLLGAMLILGQSVYTFSGLYLARVPAQVWAALLYAPVLLLWKVQLYVRVLLRPHEPRWIRTERNK